LVAAELGRRGYVATPFAGNVPMYDLLAADLSGRAVPIQVKAINGPSWQFSAKTFLDIEIGKERQTVNGRLVLPNPQLLCIFVFIKTPGTDEFYIFRLQDLQDHFFKIYKGRKKPKNIESLHCAIWPDELKQFRDNWDLVGKSLTDNLPEAAKTAKTAAPKKVRKSNPGLSASTSRVAKKATDRNATRVSKDGLVRVSSGGTALGKGGVEAIISLMKRKHGATLHDFHVAGWPYPAMTGIKAANAAGLKTRIVKNAGEVKRYYASSK
jgi:hypothetical protein